MDLAPPTLRFTRWLERSEHIGRPAQIALGLVAAVCAVALRMALEPWLGDAVAWVTFFGAVLLSAFTAGAASASATLLVCAAAGSMMWAGSGPQRLVSFAAFVASAGLLLWVGSALRRAARALHARQVALTQQISELTALHHFGTRVVASTDREQLLALLLRAAMEAQGAARGFIELFDAESGRLYPGVCVGHDARTFERLANVPVEDGQGADGTCAARQARVVVEDTELDPLFATHRAEAREAGFRAVWSTPLSSRKGELIGVLTTHFAEPHRPSNREIQLVELYGRLAADAIETATSYAHAEHARAAAESALEKLREQDRRKDEFLAMLAHELRNPLAPIRLLVDMLRVRREQSVSARELQILDRHTTSLTRIVDDLLDVARITHGEIELRPEPLAGNTLDHERAESGRSLRVLVVDDNVDAAVGLAELARHFGHRTEVAHQGVAALATARQLDPNIVLLDLGMPEMDGYEVAKRLQITHPRATLVAVTGYGQASDRARTRAAGFDHHLVKPVRLELLLEVLNEVPVQPQATAG